jgi:hypothetical protein
MHQTNIRVAVNRSAAIPVVMYALNERRSTISHTNYRYPYGVIAHKTPILTGNQYSVILK